MVGGKLLGPERVISGVDKSNESNGLAMWMQIVNQKGSYNV